MRNIFLSLKIFPIEVAEKTTLGVDFSSIPHPLCAFPSNFLSFHYKVEGLGCWMGKLKIGITSHKCIILTFIYFSRVFFLFGTFFFAVSSFGTGKMRGVGVEKKGAKKIVGRESPFDSHKVTLQRRKCWSVMNFPLISGLPSLCGGCHPLFFSFAHPHLLAPCLCLQ